jgi:hypothetical protein
MRRLQSYDGASLRQRCARGAAMHEMRRDDLSGIRTCGLTFDMSGGKKAQPF